MSAATCTAGCIPVCYKFRGVQSHLVQWQQLACGCSWHKLLFSPSVWMLVQAVIRWYFKEGLKSHRVYNLASCCAGRKNIDVVGFNLYERVVWGRVLTQNKPFAQQIEMRWQDTLQISSVYVQSLPKVISKGSLFSWGFRFRICENKMYFYSI